MGSVHRFPDNSTIAGEAREWLIRLDSDRPLTVDEDASLREWFQRSPAHVRELRRISAFWNKANVLTELAIPLQDLRGRDGSRTWGLPLSSFSHGARVCFAAFFAVAACGLFWWWSYSMENFEGTYATAVGQQKGVSLPDGSSVQLNTDSQVQISFDETGRRIRLLRGEAHFDVAHDADRPFQVFAGSSMVKAIGTAFSVYVRERQVSVTVVTGRVALNAVRASLLAAELAPPSETDSRELAALDAGQKGTLDRTTEKVDVRTLAEQELQRELSWRDGYLVFSGQSLSQVVGEVSRYTPYKIDIEDPELESLPVGGRFKVGDLDGIFEVLHASFGIEVVHLGDQHIQLQVAGNP